MFSLNQHSSTLWQDPPLTPALSQARARGAPRRLRRRQAARRAAGAGGGPTRGGGPTPPSFRVGGEIRAKPYTLVFII